MVEYIDKQEVIETVAFYREDPDGVDHALQSIMNIPAEDVQPVKHGRWIDIDDSYYGINYRCSVCNKTTALAKSYDILGNEHQYPYCPRCGAKMDGEDNG